jgi:hypothetical protein
MREIPKLQILCLRAIGPHSCSFEDAFAKTSSGEPSTASRLLRSFHQRPVEGSPPAPELALLEEQQCKTNTTTTLPAQQSSTASSILSIALKRTPCIGAGSARRDQSNEIDLNHPIIGCKAPNGNMLVMQYGNVALDCLQSYIDSLVEMGRMDDSRLGLHYFQEWKTNVILASGQSLEEHQEQEQAAAAAAVKKETASTRKRRRSNANANASTLVADVEPPSQSTATAVAVPVPVGSLSFHNCTMADETIDAMLTSQVGRHIGVLDLTGMQSLNDEMFCKLLPTCPNITRLSIKNCRRLTPKSLQVVGTLSKLQCLDVGGSYNVTPQDLLDIIPLLPDLTELHASGLAWTNNLVGELGAMREWTGLSLGFTHFLTATPLKDALQQSASTLKLLALPFCEALADNALMGVLGRNFPNLECLDLRGNPNLSSLTGWYDGRASAGLKAQPLLVLARYTGVSKQNVEETKRIHPHEATHLVCVLDGGGVGSGIRR